MAYLQQRLRAEVSGVGQTNTTQWRCVQLARDMRVATRFIMRRQFGETDSPTGNYLGQVVAAPAVAAYATLYGAGHLLDLYPHADERCALARAPAPMPMLTPTPAPEPTPTPAP
jgi:hypothetical protein